MIYFVQDEKLNLIKIGFSDNEAESRMMTLQTGSPSRLVLLGCIDGDRSTETLLHQHFASAREHGEWFRPVPALLLCIIQSLRSCRPGEQELPDHNADFSDMTFDPARKALAEKAYRRGFSQGLSTACEVVSQMNQHGVTDAIKHQQKLRDAANLAQKWRYDGSPHPTFMDDVIRSVLKGL